MTPKRFFDVSVSVFALIVLFLPLLVVAMAIKLSSKGPIFFKQRRVGKNGSVFEMFKFRSMGIDAEAQKAGLTPLNEQAGPVFKIRNDPRVTKVGRFLRKHSIDELPQLLNIVFGDMSVVGPRPALPVEVEKYSKEDRVRLRVTPGLTCIWQVSGRNRLSFREWMELDRLYVETQSFLGDILLVLKTFPVVFFGDGY
jgi:lipopolysaccharide/colanic/teichoic acid biosynthesis glycosyltransferase